MSTTDTTTTGRKGDLRIGFGFMRVKDFALPQPSLLLSRVNSPQLIVQIPLPMLHKFDYRDKELNGDPKCLKDCVKVAELVYGGFATKQDSYRVLDAITDWATEMKNMPPPSTFRNLDEVYDYMRRKGFDVADVGGQQLTIPELAH